MAKERLWNRWRDLRARVRVALKVLQTPIGNDLARKTIVAYGVDTSRRVLLLHAQGPLDLATVTVELSYSQLKFVAGQLIAQEGKLEQETTRGRLVQI